MPLDEIRGGRANGDDQIGWPVSVEGVEIFDEWASDFSLTVSHSRANGPENPRLRLSGYLGAMASRMIGPWLEAETERMQHQNALRLWISRLTLTQRRQQ